MCSSSYFLKECSFRTIFCLIVHNRKRRIICHRADHSRVYDRTRPQVRSLEFGEDETCFRSRASADSLRKINNRCRGGRRDRNGMLSVTRRSGYCAIMTATTNFIPTINRDTTLHVFDVIIGAHDSTQLSCENLPTIADNVLNEN